MGRWSAALNISEKGKGARRRRNRKALKKEGTSSLRLDRANCQNKRLCHRHHCHRWPTWNQEPIQPCSSGLNSCDVGRSRKQTENPLRPRANLDGFSSLMGVSFYLPVQLVTKKKSLNSFVREQILTPQMLMDSQPCIR